MAMTESQKKADAKWKKKHTRQIMIRLYDKSDADLIKFIDSLENRQGTIKELIRKGMK